MPYVPSDIFHAAADGVKFDSPAALYAPGNVGRTQSVKSMDVALIRTWIARGGDVNGEPDPALLEVTAYENCAVAVVYPGHRLLSVAAECDRVDVMRLLLAHGAAVNYVNHVNCERTPAVNFIREGEWGCSALMLAVLRNRVAAVRLLIENGADVNFACNTHQDPVLTLPTTFPRIVKMLLAAGADPNARNSSGRSAEEMALRSLDNFNTVIAQAAEAAEGDEPRPAPWDNEELQNLQETCEILRGTRLAGSYKKYVIQTTYPPAKDLLMLRALVCGSRRTAAGRAVAGPETPKAVALLFESCPDNGVFWLVIQYWKLGNWYYPLVREPTRPDSSQPSHPLNRHALLS